MDGPKAVIHDISSDEEEAAGERSGVGADGGGGDDYDWLARLLDDDDKEPSDDSDDVVVVGEVILNSRQTVKSSSTVSKDSAKAVDDDDGDCVVLEGDPDKPVTIDNDDERDDDSDEIQVVSEKGQVACRDYPHPRHHCAKFPFASTPHESYCDQCHCYVCDSLAPCGYWGNGISNMDHCHATDKDEFWKAKRQNTKKNNVVLAVPSGVHATVSVPLPLVNQSPLPPQLVSCNVTQNQAFAQCPIRPCSVSVSPGTPNITRQQGRQPPGFSVPNRLPGYIIPRSKFQDHLVSQPIRYAYRNGISTDRRQNVCQVGPNLIYSRTAFKRTGSVSRPLTAPRHGNTSSHNHHRPPFGTNLSLGPRYVDCGWMAPVTDTNSGSCPIDLSWIPSNPVSSQPQLSVLPSLESESVNYLPSGPQIFSQPQVNGADSLLSESQVFSPSPNYVNPMSSQPRVPYQPALGRTFTNCYPSEIRSSSQHVNGVYENSVPSEPQTLFQPYVESNSMDTALHSQASEHPNGVNNFENPMLPRPELAYQAKGPYSNNLALYEAAVDCQLSAEPCMTSNCENTDQLELSAARISLDSQNISHPANQTQNAYVPDIASLDFSNEVPFCEINEPHNVVSADKSLLAPDPNNQLAENSSPSALDLHFDNWMFEDPVVPRVIEVSVPLGLNAYSPEPAPLWD